jgi:hypothetical protein
MAIHESFNREWAGRFTIWNVNILKGEGSSFWIRTKDYVCQSHLENLIFKKGSWAPTQSFQIRFYESRTQESGLCKTSSLGDCDTYRSEDQWFVSSFALYVVNPVQGERCLKWSSRRILGGIKSQWGVWILVDLSI